MPQDVKASKIQNKYIRFHSSIILQWLERMQNKKTWLLCPCSLSGILKGLISYLWALRGRRLAGHPAPCGALHSPFPAHLSQQSIEPSQARTSSLNQVLPRSLQRGCENEKENCLPLRNEWSLCHSDAISRGPRASHGARLRRTKVLKQTQPPYMSFLRLPYRGTMRWGLEKTETYSLCSGSWKSGIKVSTGPCSPESLGEKNPSRLFQFPMSLANLGTPWLAAASPHLRTVIFPLCLRPLCMWVFKCLSSYEATAHWVMAHPTLA